MNPAMCLGWFNEALMHCKSQDSPGRGSQNWKQVGQSSWQMIEQLESHELGLLDENRHLEHKLCLTKVGKELHEAQDVGSRKAVTDAKVEHANAKESLRVFKTQAAADRAVLRSAIDGCHHVQDIFWTTFRKLSVA